MALSRRLLPLFLRRGAPIPARALSTAVAPAAVASEEDEAAVTVKGVRISGRPLYMDMQATTPVDPRVLDAMLPFYLSRYGNPHSRTHLYGWESDAAVEDARARVASLVGADPREIFFTSGATECNNIAVKGVMRFYRERRRHVITTQTEHKCVLDSCRYLQHRRDSRSPISPCARTGSSTSRSSRTPSAWTPD